MSLRGIGGGSWRLLGRDYMDFGRYLVIECISAWVGFACATCSIRCDLILSTLVMI